MAASDDPIDLREEDVEDRGRGAERPTHLPSAGWKDVALRVKHEMREDHISILAAGVAFYLMLSLFPFAIAALSIYGLVSDPADVIDLIDRFRQAVPSSVANLLEEQLVDIAEQPSSGLTFGAIASVLFALWSASKGAKALIDATNVAYEERETRGFVRLRLLALAYTLALLVVIIASVAVIAILPVVFRQLGDAGRIAFAILRWPLLATIIVVALAAAYRYAPARAEAKWRWVSAGSVVATVLWLAGSALFAVYANSFGSFSETYGSISAVIVLLLWLDLASFAILLGAEINAETEHQTARDSTDEPDQPMGRRGAHMADDLGRPVSVDR